MSFTTTISSYSSVNSAPFRMSCTSCPYPDVRYLYALATRAGVRASPSRDGSSPSSARKSRINCSIIGSPRGSVLTAVLEIVVVGLHHGHAPQPSRRQRGLEPGPEGPCQILSGRHDALQAADGRRQIVVIDAVQQRALNGAVDDAEVDRHPGQRIDVAAHRHLHLVVVAVLPIALPVDARIVLVAERRAGQAMPRAEMVATREPKLAHGPKYSTQKVGSSQRRRRCRRSPPSLGASSSQMARTRFSVVGMLPLAKNASRFRSAWSKRATTRSPTRRFNSVRSITMPVTGSTGPRIVTSRT